MTDGEVRDLRSMILHDTNANTYRVLAHNFTLDEANTFIAEWNPHLVEGAKALAIAQRRRHQTQNPEDCRTCREGVKQSSGLNPLPRFTRRKK